MTRSISKGPLGKVASALRPKNIGKFIMEGGVDKVLKGGVKNVTNFVKNPGKTIQKITKNITESPLTKRITQTATDLLQKVKSIKPGETIQNLTKNITQGERKSIV